MRDNFFMRIQSNLICVLTITSYRVLARSLLITFLDLILKCLIWGQQTNHKNLQIYLTSQNIAGQEFQKVNFSLTSSLLVPFSCMRVRFGVLNWVTAALPLWTMEDKVFFLSLSLSLSAKHRARRQKVCWTGIPRENKFRSAFASELVRERERADAFFHK